MAWIHGFTCPFLTSSLWRSLVRTPSMTEKSTGLILMACKTTLTKSGWTPCKLLRLLSDMVFRVGSKLLTYFPNFVRCNCLNLGRSIDRHPACGTINLVFINISHSPYHLLPADDKRGNRLPLMGACAFGNAHWVWWCQDMSLNYRNFFFGYGGNVIGGGEFANFILQCGKWKACVIILANRHHTIRP